MAAEIGSGVASQAPPLPAGRTASLVEVVGCLRAAPGETWEVTDATAPVATKSPATSTAALEEAARRPLGTGRFRLLGVDPFDPASRVGRKVAVKGVLVTGQNESRLNVTSLQSVGDPCAR
jgi:hypothetical protein